MTTRPVDATAAPTIIDRYLPVYDVTLREHLVVEADVTTTWQALRELDLLDVHSPLVDAAFRVRDVPIRLARRLRHEPPPPPPPALRVGSSDADMEGWLALGTRDGAEVAFGAAGVFWGADVSWCDVDGSEEFVAWDRPGTGRVAAAFQLRPYGETRTLATYEARTAVPDAPSRRRFLRYWRLVSPFVGVIMRATLRTLAADAEAIAVGRPAAAGGAATQPHGAGTE